MEIHTGKKQHCPSDREKWRYMYETKHFGRVTTQINIGIGNKAYYSWGDIREGIPWHHRGILMMSSVEKTL